MLLRFAALALLASCGTPPAPGLSPVPATRMVPGGPTSVTFRIFHVMNDMGLRPYLGEAANTASSAELIATRRAPVAGIRTARLFDCGRVAGTPLADGPVRVTVTGHAQPVGDSSRVVVYVRGAIPADRWRPRDQACVSTGLLESIILERLARPDERPPGNANVRRRGVRLGRR